MFSLPVRTHTSTSPTQPTAPAAQEPSTPSNGSEIGLIGLSTRNNPAGRRAQAVIEPVAQATYSPSNSSEMSMTIHNHPAVRRAVASCKAASDCKIVITLSNAKDKAKKNVSTATMLKKKGKISKKDSKKVSKGGSKKGSKGKKLRKTKTPSKRPLVHRIAGKVTSYIPPQLLISSKDNIDEAGRALMAKEDAAFDNVYKTFLAGMEGDAAADAAFVQSINDAIDVITAPLEVDKVESTISRGNSHVTQISVVGEQVKAYQEHVKKHEATMASYLSEWENLQDDMARLGIQVNYKNSFPTSESSDVTMADTFIHSMERLNLEHNRKVHELASQMQVVEDRLMNDQRVAEEVS